MIKDFIIKWFKSSRFFLTLLSLIYSAVVLYIHVAIHELDTPILVFLGGVLAKFIAYDCAETVRKS